MSMPDMYDDDEAKPRQRQDVAKTTAVPVTATAGNSIERAGIDAQLAAARANPRGMQQFMGRCQAMIALPGVADECVYSLPRAGKKIEGASSRFAEIIVSQYGNCRVSGAIVDESADYVTARGLFHDLESNMATAVEVQRRIIDSRGRRFNADMIVVTGNAAVSIAIRNATLRGIPKALWKGLYDRACEIIAGGGMTPDAVMKAVAYCEKKGISHERMLAFLEIEDVSLMTPEHLVTLRGAWQAIKDGEATLEEMFPVEAPPAPPAAKAKVERGKSVPKTEAAYNEGASVPWLDDFMGRCITTDEDGLGDLAVELADHEGKISGPAHVEATKALEQAVERCSTG